MERLHVLVVDDEPGMRLAVSRTLQNYSIRLQDVDGEIGFDVNQAATGEEALNVIESSKPDIVLLDQKLPGISGLDVLSELAQKDHDLLTVMITAYATLEAAVSATKRGAFDFLAKPFTPEELKATVYKSAKHLLFQRHARKLSQEKRQFRFQLISIVAHELKAPLAAIEQYLNILGDGTTIENAALCEEIVTRSLLRVQGMRKLITDLLDLTRIESGQRKRDLVEVDVRKVAEAAISTVKPNAQERNIAIQLHCGDPVSIRADRDEIEIILNNLLSNAVKYNRDGGRADIMLEAKDGTVGISVADTGIGMTQEEAGRLFNDFARIKNEKTEGIMGSGLGLSIVKKIAMLYNGRVSVTSEPDKGSTFTVTLAAANGTSNP